MCEVFKYNGKFVGNVNVFVLLYLLLFLLKIWYDIVCKRIMLIIFYCIVNIFLEFNNCKFCNEVCEKVVEEILWFGIE